MNTNVEMVRELLNRHDPIWEKQASQWTEGLLLGNGEMGAVLWGDGNPFICNLDHTQFWDRNGWTPPVPENFKWTTFKSALKEGKLAEVVPSFQRPSGTTHYPTRLPPSRIEFRFDEEVENNTMKLSLFGAQSHGEFKCGNKTITFRAFLLATLNVFRIEFTGAKPQLQIKFFSDRPLTSPPIRKFLDENQYETSTFNQTGGYGIYSQVIPDGGETALAYTYEQKENTHSFTFSLAYVRNAQDSDAATASSTTMALIDTYLSNESQYEECHRNYWLEHYTASWLSVPAPKLEGLYWNEIYKLGCCTKPGAAPISLHGPWSPDGIMPKWSGDYHHNINVQMSYWPIYTGNRLSLGDSLYTFIDNARPKFQRFCRDFFEMDGEFVVHGTDLDGNPTYDSGYCQFEFNGGPWLAHHMWLHWKYSQDDDFALRRLYPFLKAISLPLLQLLEEGDDGRLHFPWSYSPEYGGREGVSWGPDATIDLALVRWMLEALITCENLSPEPDPSQVHAWRSIHGALAEYPVAPVSSKPNQYTPRGLMVRSDLPLETSHRHHSHLMPIHPLQQLNIHHASPEEQQLIQDSIRNLMLWGHGEWVGFSFTWAASIAAYVKLPNLASSFLEDYANRFVTANTLMMQGAQGHSDMTTHGTYGLTLESGFGFANALQELLLQSEDGAIRIFPALPDGWKEASFESLRAVGGYLVSAIYAAGRLQYAKIVSEKGGDVSVSVANDQNYRVLIEGMVAHLPKLTLSAGQTAEIFDAQVTNPNIKPVGGDTLYHHFGVKL
jgi:alpha-L-fucosidase 2